jgi:subfamily B ATP-binding cassette protein MsbA
VAAYLVLLARALPYAQIISRGRVEYAARSGSLREVEWLLEQKPAPTGPAISANVEQIDRPIRFEQVSFIYPDGTKALDRIDVVLRPGIATALVGKSGAGKSSFIDLVCRLVDPTSGRILHGDQPLYGIDPQSWRSRIAVAGQNVGLVDGTIAENIAYGKPDSSLVDISTAAAAARASEFINALPNGFDTRLGLDGLKLSGGERQRIELARALLRKPDLLILDEATSAVDVGLEQEIIALLKEGRWFSTALVISHRKATLAACKDGIVIDGGRVIEAGLLSELDYFRSMGAELEV